MAFQNLKHYRNTIFTIIKKEKESEIKKTVAPLSSHTANINPVRQNPQERGVS